MTLSSQLLPVICMGCQKGHLTAKSIGTVCPQWCGSRSGRVGQEDRNAQETAAAEGYREISTTEEFNLLPPAGFQGLEWVSHEQNTTSRAPCSGHPSWLHCRAAWSTRTVPCGARPEGQSRNLEFWNFHVRVQGVLGHEVKSLLSYRIKIAKAA